MTTNLLEILKSYISPASISSVSSTLGESEESVTRAISTAIPSLLTGLAHKSDDKNSLSNIIDLAKQNNSNSDSILSNVSSVFNNSGDSTPMELGSKLLRILFGNKQSSVSNMISNVSGVRSESASALLGMVSPLLLSHLGKSGYTLTSLTNLLTKEKDSILANTPAGLESLVGFSNKRNINYAQKKNIASDEISSNFPKWLVPVLLIGLTLVSLYFLTKKAEVLNSNSNIGLQNIDSVNNKENLKASTTLKTEHVIDSTTIILGQFIDLKLPNNVELSVPEKGIENKLVKWVSDKSKLVDKTTWFNFDRLLFETGKSTLKPESQEQLKNIYEVMKAYPSVEIKLGGYTDNTGNSVTNLKLSDERAKAVMIELVKLGIAENRIAAEGYGDQFPVAPNDTKDGRAQNRRIAVRVTKK